MRTLTLIFIFSVFRILGHSQVKYVEMKDSTFQLNDVLNIKHEIRFSICNDWFNKYVSNESDTSITEIADFLNTHKEIVIEIGVYTGLRGGVPYNDTLSKSRAAMLHELFIRKGVDSAQLVTHGYGELVPAVAYKSNESHSLRKPENNDFELVTLTEEYINQYKKVNKKQFELLHLINERIEFKIIQIND